jgi:hypothetical protein
MSEHALQVAVVHMLQVVLDPERTWWSAIDHAAKLSKRYGGERKRRGVKAGLPDFILMWMDDNLIGIELKTAKGTVSPAQSDVATSWTLMGFGVFVARSLEEVQEILEFCRVPMRTRMKFLGGVDGRTPRAAPPRHPRAKRQRKSKSAVPVVLRRSA